MRRRAKRWVFGILGSVLLFAVGGVGTLSYLFPFGHRPCTLNCMYLALQNYADDHDGFYPNSKLGPLDALRKLYPEYVVGMELAGITGDQTTLKSILESGKPLDKSATSWVYVPGLNQKDGPDLAVLWEARKGILLNGRRASGPVHAVLFNDSFSIKLIPDSEWDKFLKQQELLREKTFKSRLSGG
jgi:hypothetical protein